MCLFRIFTPSEEDDTALRQGLPGQRFAVDVVVPEVHRLRQSGRRPAANIALASPGLRCDVPRHVAGWLQAPGIVTAFPLLHRGLQL